MAVVAVDGETFRVVVEGDAGRPALVLLHMLGSDLTLWDGQLPALTAHFRVVRYDSRGHGGSPVGEGPCTIDRLGRDSLGILDALDIGKAHVCGASMGGAVVQWLLIHAPERVERAVLADTAANFGPPAVWNERIATALAHGMEPNVDATLERWFSPGFAERQPALVAKVATSIRATPPVGYAGCAAALRDLDFRHALRGVRHPVLLINGADDPVASDEAVADIMGALENATQVVLDARHAACVEAQGEFNAALLAFLTAKASPRRAASRRSPAEAAARRLGAVGRGAARRPVAKTAPASGKAAAKASAARKTATRKAAKPAAPAPARRRTTAAEPARTTQAAAKAATKAAPASPREVATGTEAPPATSLAPARRTPAARPTAGRSGPAKPAKPARGKPAGTEAEKTATAQTEGSTGKRAAIKRAAAKETPAAGSKKGAAPEGPTNRGEPKTSAPPRRAPAASAPRRPAGRPTGGKGRPRS